MISLRNERNREVERNQSTKYDCVLCQLYDSDSDSDR